jgi:SAM-dependent methyltransferase
MKYETIANKTPIFQIIRCPKCFSYEIDAENAQNSHLKCASCGTSYLSSKGRPVLLSPENEIFKSIDYHNLQDEGSHKFKNHMKRILPKLSVNMSREKILTTFIKKSQSNSDPLVLVIGCGNQRAELENLIKGNDATKIIYTDVDVNSDADIFCDAHNQPFQNLTFDIVITTAVMEHVMYPEQVAKEIIRILKIDGLLYSELPFMQQVHEGAYDFTRYSLSGHKRLFNRISVIKCGIVAGPATALVWAIESFLLAFIKSNKSIMLVKIFVRLIFSWIKYFDYILVHHPSAIDGASCTYIWGTKNSKAVTDISIIREYNGGQSLSHNS